MRRARPAQQGMTGGAYLTIANGTEQSDTLISISTEVAAMAEVHESFQQEDGLSGMRPAGKLPIEPRSLLELKPGAYHIMLMQVHRSLVAGDTISATLHFGRNDRLQVPIPVRQNRN
ncbi:MAG: copper chaperone PCu(A)C [Balneolaceae bacterium]|nr:copper chaperone PCu(A)C [Balneolaceae bacterium]